jgi:hypothetical protein
MVRGMLFPAINTEKAQSTEERLVPSANSPGSGGR